MMTSSCGLQMAVTFDGMIFLIWGRPFLDLLKWWLQEVDADLSVCMLNLQLV